MISARNVSLQFGGRPLFEHVDIQFTNGNCYGLIGANGTGKSTFLRILSGELEPNKGEVFVTPGVITSYSIHYTKLYDASSPASWSRTRARSS